MWTVLALLLTACNGGSSPPVSQQQMGGSIQGVQLALSAAVSTIAGPTSAAIDGQAQTARFDAPSGITSDGTYLYVADSQFHTIRKVSIATGDVTTLAGLARNPGMTDGVGSSGRFNTPAGIATDGTSLFVADNGNNTIRKVVVATGAVATLAGSAGNWGSQDGTGTAAQFASPKGVVVVGGNLYVTDSSNCTIRKVEIATGAVTTFAGSAGSWGSADGTGAAAQFASPQGIATDGVNLFVADSGNRTIRKIEVATGQVTTLAGATA
ncbi:MAG TPA: hypothetical protein VL949_05175, partial [Geobacteraceae bacterium]|nr:hypothetical protein [Geobacteraceae bacterium]